jgi:cobalt-zinc-cadmium efflux system outer membrane protein
MKLYNLFWMVIFACNLNAQMPETISFSFEEGKNRMLKENIRLLAEYYNVDLAEAEIQQLKLWDNPLFVWNAEMYSVAENKYFAFENQKLLQIEYAFSISGKRINAVKEAKIGKEIAELALADMIRGLVLEYSEVFYEHIELSQKNEVLLQSLQQYDRLIAQYAKGKELGINSESELIRLKSERQSILSEINENEKDLLNKELALKMLMNVAPNSKLKPQRSVGVSIQKKPIEEFYNLALSQRPDIKISIKSISKSQMNLKKQKAESVPNINLGYQPHDQGSNHVRPYVGMVFEMGIPVFNRNQGEIAAAKIQIEQNQLLLKYKQNEVKNEITAALAALERSEELVNSFNQDLMNEMEELSIAAKENYEKRNISLYEYIDFQRSYLQNMLNFIEANRMLNAAINQFYFTIGSDLK